MCEPLRGKIRNIATAKHFFFDDVKSAVEFYKKYREPYWRNLKREYPKIFAEYIKKRENETTLMYEDWLFDYCFADVIE